MRRSNITIELSNLAKAFGHPLRILILQELVQGSCIVSELMKKLSVDASLLSKHLSVLRQVNLIECEVEWRCRRYHLQNEEAVCAILDALNDVLKGSET